jgi:hypothetical protein
MTNSLPPGFDEVVSGPSKIASDVAGSPRLSAGTNIGRIGKSRACATAALPGPDQTGGAGRGACSDTAQASRGNTAGGKP